MNHTPTPVNSSRRAALLALTGCFFASASLSSCGDEAKQKENASAAPTPPPAATPAPAPETEAKPSATASAPVALTREEAKKQLDELLYNEVKTLINTTAANPTIRDTATMLLERLENYYKSMSQEPVSIERVKLALDIASFQRELGAWQRSFDSYERALKEWESLDIKQKAELPIQQIKSSIYNGLGAVLLYLPIPADDAEQIAKQKKDSLNYFKEQLDNDLSIFTAAAPKEGETIPDEGWGSEVDRATQDLISSYRCVGDGLRFNDEIDQAREAYTQGVKVAQRVQKLGDKSSLQLLKILSALGDLERSQEKKQEAYSHWGTAVRIATQISKSSRSSSSKFEAVQIANRLTPLLQRLQLELQQEASEAEAAADQTPTASESPAQ